MLFKGNFDKFETLKVREGVYWLSVSKTAITLSTASSRLILSLNDCSKSKPFIIPVLEPLASSELIG